MKKAVLFTCVLVVTMTLLFLPTMAPAFVILIALAMNVGSREKQRKTESLTSE